MSYILDMLSYTLWWFFFCMVFFSLLALVVPNIKRQRFLRDGLLTDVLYWFLTPTFYGLIFQWLFFGLTSLLLYLHIITDKEFAHHGLALFIEYPVPLQILIVLLCLDILQYGTHRLFHGITLWKYHAIHHSPKELDWISGVRFHPVNLFVHSTLTVLLVYILGFAPLTFIFLAPFNIFYSALVHANVNWTFGKLGYVFVSPVFHRWHHTSPSEGGEKNFAPTFPFIDILFGTFYMPKGKLPQQFGVSEPVPNDILGQMMYPFRMKKAGEMEIS